MKLSTLERNKDLLSRTIFTTDKTTVTIGLKCLVVVIHGNHWEGDFPTEFNNIPVTYLFDVPRDFLEEYQNGKKSA